MEDIYCTPSRKSIISWVKTLPSVSTLKPNSSYWTSGCSEGSFCKDNQMKCISLVVDFLTSVNQSDVSLTWGEVAFYFSCIIAWYLIFGCFVVYMSILFLISKSLYLFTSNQSNTCLHIYKTHEVISSHLMVLGQNVLGPHAWGESREWSTRGRCVGT